jgi:hypothetical protein
MRVAAVLFALCTPILAQWLNYPTAGVPKDSKGEPDLTAPTPKAADGKPDLSGTWEPLKNNPCPPEGCADFQMPKEFTDIGWSLKGGLPLQQWAADLKKARRAQYGKDDPGSHCMPTGIVKLHTTALLKKIIQTPGLLVILNERNVEFRQIFTDGRPLPSDPDPTYNGFSTGKWEGDTLVVQTNGIRDGEWLDRAGSPLTDAAKITEKFRRPNYGNLEIELTVDDPKAYTAPWTVKLHQTIVLNTEFFDYYCIDNEKDMTHLVGK